ncbi:MAG: hypothetical protein M9941_17945 [Anaerolineae bacterium]|nr:hypothetical protein [Anaerolineae bacterium]
MANYIASLELAYLQHLANEERERQDAIVTARNLYDGTIASTLLAELKAALLSGDTTVVPALLNIYRTKVEEIEARLTVNDFYDEPQHDGRPPAGNRLPWVARLWVDVGLAMEQHEVHQAVLRDGESFVILNPDPQRGILRPVHHPRFTDALAGGDGFGCKAHVDDGSGRVLFYSKRWTEQVQDGNRRRPRQRMTLYIEPDGELPARIEKYRAKSAADIAGDGVSNSLWIQYQEDGDLTWPLWWTNNNSINGDSLPLPIVHFTNIGKERAGETLRGPQAVLDNFVTATIATASLLGTGGLTVLGGYPTTDGEPPAEDGSNVWRLGPRTSVGFPDKKPSEAKIDQLKAADLSQMLNAIQFWITTSAVTTGTTSLLMQHLGRANIAATLFKQTDLRPIAVTRKSQTVIGAKWSELLQKYVALHNHFELGETLPTGSVYVSWLPADVLGYDAIAEATGVGGEDHAIDSSDEPG